MVLYGVATLIFFIFSINPGDPARMLLDQRATQESVQAVKRELGLDLPVFEQYLLYLNDLSPVSFHKQQNSESPWFYSKAKYGGGFLKIGHYGIALKWPYLRRSYQSRRNVSDIIEQAMPATALLAVAGIALAMLLGLIIGILSALNKNGFFDRISLVTAVLGMSSPSFFAAIIISWLGGYIWHASTNLPALPFVFLAGAWLIALMLKRKNQEIKAGRWAFKGFFAGAGLQFLAWIVQHFTGAWITPFADASIHLHGTGLNMTGSMYAIDTFRGPYFSPANLILPAITLGIRPLAVIVQLMRSSLLEVLSQDYIRTARAKGLKMRKVIWSHALRNALNPVITAVSGWFASMLAGAVFVEYVFNWRGLGLQVYHALETEDFPVLMGAVLVIAFTFVVINIIVDILYGILDPRISVS